MPLIKEVKFSFYERPRVDFTLRPLRSIDLMDMPGLSGFLKGMVDWALDQYIVVPGYYTYSLVHHSHHGSSDETTAHAIGVAKIIIYQARGLAWDGIEGDPFVKVQVSGKCRGITRGLQKQETAGWNEAFHVPIVSLREQLSLTLGTGVGEDLGSLKISIEEAIAASAAAEPDSLHFTVSRTLSNGGELLFGLQFAPIEDEEKISEVADTASVLSGDDQQSFGSCTAGLVTISLTQLRDLGDQAKQRRGIYYQIWIHTKDHPPIDPQDETPPPWESGYFRSMTRKRGSQTDPSWDEPFQVFIGALHQAHMTIMFRDQKEDATVLARWRGPLAPHLGINGWLHCDQPEGARIYARISLRPINGRLLGLDPENSTVIPGIGGGMQINHMALPVAVLQIQVVSAAGLSKLGSSNSWYVQVEVNGRKIGQTSNKSKDDLVWKERIHAILHSLKSDTVAVNLMNARDIGKDALIARIPLDLPPSRGGQAIELDETIDGRDGRLRLILSLHPVVEEGSNNEQVDKGDLDEDLDVDESSDKESRSKEEAAITSGILVISSIATRAVKSTEKVYCEYGITGDTNIEEFRAKTNFSKGPCEAFYTWTQSAEILIVNCESSRVWVQVRESRKLITKQQSPGQIVGMWSSGVAQLVSGKWYKLLAERSSEEDFDRVTGQVMLQSHYLPVRYAIRNSTLTGNGRIVQIHLVKAVLSSIRDPYCAIRLQGRKVFKSRIVRRTLGPIWDQIATVPVKENPKRPSPFLQLALKDWSRFGSNDLIGTCTIQEAPEATNEWSEHKLAISDEQGQPQGELHFRLFLEGPSEHSEVDSLEGPAVNDRSFEDFEEGKVFQLKVQIRQARDLRAKTPKSSNQCDPYCSVYLIDEKDEPQSPIDKSSGRLYKTKVHKKTDAPVWMESFETRIGGDQKSLLFNVKDRNHFQSDQIMGTAKVAVDAIPRNQMTEMHLELMDGSFTGTLDIFIGMFEPNNAENSY